MPDPLPYNLPDIEDVRLSLVRVRRNLERYSGAELLALTHTAETTAHMIRLELKGRDARVVDQACALKEAS